MVFSHSFPILCKLLHRILFCIFCRLKEYRYHFQQNVCNFICIKEEFRPISNIDMVLFISLTIFSSKVFHISKSLLSIFFCLLEHHTYLHEYMCNWLSMIHSRKSFYLHFILFPFKAVCHPIADLMFHHLPRGNISEGDECSWKRKQKIDLAFCLDWEFSNQRIQS